MLPEFEIHNGKKYPILWRKRGSEETDTCKFCLKKHKHGKGDGHRIKHCTDIIDRRARVIRSVQGYFLSDGTYVDPNDGYILMDYPIISK